MFKVHRLVSSGQVVGYRAIDLTNPQNMFDISLSSPALKNKVVILSDVSDDIKLVPHNDLLVSQSELTSGVLAKDISSDVSAVEQYFLRQRKFDDYPSRNYPSFLSLSPGPHVVVTHFYYQAENTRFLMSRWAVVIFFNTTDQIDTFCSFTNNAFFHKKMRNHFASGVKAFRTVADNSLSKFLTCDMKSSLYLPSKTFLVTYSDPQSGSKAEVALSLPSFEVKEVSNSHKKPIDMQVILDIKKAHSSGKIKLFPADLTGLYINTLS